MHGIYCGRVMLRVSPYAEDFTNCVHYITMVQKLFQSIVVSDSHFRALQGGALVQSTCALLTA